MSQRSRSILPAVLAAFLGLAGCGGCGGEDGDTTPSTCGDATCGGNETCGNCAADCGACPTGHCSDGAQSVGETGVDCGGPCLACDFAGDRSEKRGVAYNFCDWDFSEGQADIDLLVDGTTAGSGATWFYNWGATPGGCIADSASLRDDLEFVPMVWGLSNQGATCASGGACFTDARSRDQYLALVPTTARYLLGFNEPNFSHQSGLTPSVAAAAWIHLEYVADARGLELVGPAINFCDTTPGSNHGGSCTEEPAQRTVTFDDYTETFPAAYRYNAFEWAELFYDECSADGVAGHDCRIDYQAGHVYSYWGLDWFVAIWKRKAGLTQPTDAHCSNGTEDDDEFGVDCGGNECAACSAWARAQFAHALWITEFAPSTDDAGSAQSTQQRLDRTNAYIDSQLPILEADPFVFRYAWFMPKTDIGSLDHVDLLTETTPVDRTAVGTNYLNEPHAP